MKFKEKEQQIPEEAEEIKTPVKEEKPIDMNKILLLKAIKNNIDYALDLLNFSRNCLDKLCSCHEGDDQSETDGKDE